MAVSELDNRQIPLARSYLVPLQDGLGNLLGKHVYVKSVSFMATKAKKGKECQHLQTADMGSPGGQNGQV
jgi:hypothetical protein